MKFFASAFSGAHARWFRLSVAPILLISLWGMILFSVGCSSDDSEDVVFPTPPDEEQMNWIFDVYGTAADNVFACGNKGAMFHYNGTSWTKDENMGVGSPITTIWGPGDGTLYAAGHDGKIWQNVGGTDGNWSSMSSGSTENLFGLGQFNSSIHATGANGAIRRLNGSTWVAVEDVVILRDPESLAPTDTLDLNQDIPSVITVSEYFLGGAYNLPDFEGELIGLDGTSGMVLAMDDEPELYDWRLRPLSLDQYFLPQWITAATSSVVNVEDNYLGTSEGWIFKIKEGSNPGELVIERMEPDVTLDRYSGIRDMWLDADSNLYFVTDDGEMVIQSNDYDFGNDVGYRKVFPISHAGLTSIWGADTDNIFMSGFTENSLIQASMDFSDTSLVFTVVPVDFLDNGGKSIGMMEDHQGLPRF